MSNYEATKYDFSGANLTGIEGIPTGTIVPWSTGSVPTGFLECNGAAVSRSTYSGLFAVVSTTYGAGDGASTFNLPDLQDKVAISKSGTTALASTGGANTVASTGNVSGNAAAHTLSSPEMPGHSHPTAGNRTNSSNAHPSFNVGFSPSNTGSTGGGGSHTHNVSATFAGDATSVLQPYLTVMYVIKT